MLDTDDLVHDDNQQVCHDLGGFLPEPRDEGENQFLDSLGTGTFVLGLTDRDVEGQWIWDSDGSPVTWKSWIVWHSGLSEPYGGERENCAVMAKQLASDQAGHRSEGWADYPCQSIKYEGQPKPSLVCERPPGKQIVIYMKQW